MANNFTIEGRAASVMKDIQRGFAWEISFPNLGNLIDAVKYNINIDNGLQEEFTVRARSVQIPERGVEIMESHFGPLKQLFPGKPTFTNNFSVVLEESENQAVIKMLYAWQQSIFDITKGYSNKLGKRPGNTPAGYVTDAILQLKKYNGEFEDKLILFKNCFVQNVGSVDLSYDGGNESVKYTAQFGFDWHYLLSSTGEPIVTL